MVKGPIRKSDNLVKDMANLFGKFLNSMNLNEEDDDLELDLDDEETYTSRERRKEATAATQERAQTPPRRFEARPLRSAQQTTTVLRERNEEPETPEQPRRVISRQERQPMPLRSASHGLEVSIMKPRTFEDAKDICDMLKDDLAIIINLEDSEPVQAQRLMDFIFGSIYALEAKIHQISGYVFCISPSKVDISGDYIEMISENNGFEIPKLQ